MALDFSNHSPHRALKICKSVINPHLLHWFQRPILTLCLALGISSGVYATSCVPLESRYFVLCDGNSCKGSFSVHDVAASSTCSRRPVVGDLGPSAGTYLSKLVMAASEPNPRGLYMVKLPFRYWHDLKPNTDEGIIEIIDESLLRVDRTAQGVRTMDMAEVAKLLSKRFNGQWITLVEVESSVQSVAKKRAAFETDALKEKVKSTLFWMASWLTALLALLALVHSVHMYFSRLYSGSSEKGRFALLTPLSIQFAIASIGVAVAFSMPFVDFWPGILLVPAVIPILLAEGWARFLNRRGR